MSALHYAAYFDVPQLIRVVLEASQPGGEMMVNNKQMGVGRGGNKGCSYQDTERMLLLGTDPRDLFSLTVLRMSLSRLNLLTEFGMICTQN